MELVIVRHGRPEHIEAGAAEAVPSASGPADPDLAAIGHRQAERVGEYLAPMGIDAIVSSPLARARQTAEPLARALGLEPMIVDGVAEYDRHDTTYVPAEVTRQRVKDGAADEGWSDPLGGLGDDERRAWMAGVERAFADIVADHPGRRVAVFCHGMVTSVWFAQMLGIDDTLRFVPDYAGVSRVLASSGSSAVTVRSFNETHFLGDTHIPLFEK